MLCHDPLLLDRTKDEDVDAEEAAVVEDSLQNNASSESTTNFVSIVANPDISLSIVPNCQIIDLVLAFDHKAADLPSNKSIPFQKKGWRKFHLKMKAKLISPPLTNLNHWSRLIQMNTCLQGMSQVWVTPQYFGHGCDGYGYSVRLCYTATDCQPVTTVYGYLRFSLQVTPIFAYIE